MGIKARYVFESLSDDFSDMMVNNLIHDNTGKWATYNAVKIELKNYDKVYNEEFKYRISDNENPDKVCLDIINKIKNPSSELLRLKNKIASWQNY